MMRFDTTCISRLRAWPLDDHSGYEVSFASSHVGRYHQVYVNGHLVDCTDSPDARSIIVDTLDGPVHIAIAAVAAADRFVDGSASLPTEATDASWAVELSALRKIDHCVDETWSLVVSQAGEPGEAVASSAAWPLWALRWAMGEDPLGLGGFGWNGYLAPGLGYGHFGRGKLGFDVHSMTLSTRLTTEGEHTCFIRSRDQSGNQADSTPTTITATPPPPAPAALEIVAYDATEQTLTVTVESETP